MGQHSDCASNRSDGPGGGSFSAPLLPTNPPWPELSSCLPHYTGLNQERSR